MLSSVPTLVWSNFCGTLLHISQACKMCESVLQKSTHTNPHVCLQNVSSQKMNLLLLVQNIHKFEKIFSDLLG